MHASRCASHTDGFAQKGRLATISLDYIKRYRCGDGYDEAWEPGTTAKVDSPLRRRCHQWDELETVFDVARPKQRFIATRNEVDSAIPTQQERGEDL
jgi:hypothetical protein